uniref:Acyl-CoA thioesterase 11 n=1 Tax=Sus scrofa TaxID=9823 RepID=A0A8D1ZI69_PIG
MLQNVGNHLRRGLASVFSNRASKKSAPRSENNNMGDGEGYRNPTEVQMSQLVLPCHTNQRGELSVGQLLKWIDATACLSAERHAGCPCVTASMDDIYFEHTISVGHVVNIKAKVNRAFNSSMEVGIQVASEDLCSEKQWNVCKALATFVAHRELSKVKLKPTTPRTEEEKMEHSVAAERRRMRLVYADTIKDLLAHYVIHDDLESKDYSRMVPAEKTRVESVELVLPPHANHQGNTFGGQIMAWMENVATIAASRLCHAHPTLKAIEMFHFRGPSQVGDRLVLKAIVNNAFKHSMEVGVCVEAYRQEAETHRRHINSAFMTFVVLDADDQPQILPWIRPQPGDGERRYREASARKKIRLDRQVEAEQWEGTRVQGCPSAPRPREHASLRFWPCAGRWAGPLHPGSLSSWPCYMVSDRPHVQVRTLRTKGVGGHGHTDGNSQQNENSNLARSGRLKSGLPPIASDDHFTDEERKALRSSLVLQWVKDLASSLQWLSSLLWHGFDPWPGNLSMLHAWPKKKKEEGESLCKEMQFLKLQTRV